eukprot:358513-Chlamydomonas_euryale.AAC.7
MLLSATHRCLLRQFTSCCVGSKSSKVTRAASVCLQSNQVKSFTHTFVLSVQPIRKSAQTSLHARKLLADVGLRTVQGIADGSFHPADQYCSAHVAVEATAGQLVHACSGRIRKPERHSSTCKCSACVHVYMHGRGESKASQNSHIGACMHAPKRHACVHNVHTHMITKHV